METEIVLGPIQEKWLQSLEQHPERQGKNSLGRMNEDGTYTACCLGEGGLIAGVCEWEDGRLVNKSNGSAQVLDGNNYESLGLNGPTGTLRDDIEKIGIKYVSLAQMNDKGFTWPKIAAEIRKDPSNFFTKSV